MHGKSSDTKDHGRRPPKKADMGELLSSYYNKGHKTASGDSFDPRRYTAASNTLPFGSVLRVEPHCEEGEKGKPLLVYINDDGPHAKGRKLDVTSGAAKHLCMKDDGEVKLHAAYLGNARKNPGLFRQWANQPGQGFGHIPDSPDDLKPAKTLPHYKPQKKGKHR